MTNEQRLLRGEHIKILPNLVLRHPTVKEVLSIDGDIYGEMVGKMTFDVIQIAHILWEKDKTWYKDINSFEWFCTQYHYELVAEVEALKHGVLHPSITRIALCFFLGGYFVPLRKDGAWCLFDERRAIHINEHTFKYIGQIVKTMNMVGENELIGLLRDAGNKMAAQYIFKQMKNQSKKKSTSQTLETIVSCLMWIGGKSKKEVYQYSLFEAYEGFQRLQIKDNWDKTMFGYYSGTLDTSKNKINFDKLSWSKNIK